MRLRCSSTLIACVLLVSALVWPTAAVADWDPPDGHKMHFPQMPDETTNGIDVLLGEYPYSLADDFQCTESGLITSIHFWASWKLDQIGDPGIWLTICSDNPSGANGHSEPLEELEWYYFGQGQYTSRLWTNTVAGEGWYDPVLDEYIPPPADRMIWQYNFEIPSETAFTQEQGTIYWLMIDVDPMSTNFIGWKTSPDHWNDDAVWYDDLNGMWRELRYPLGHPFESNSMDFAFVINGGPPGQPGTNGYDYGDAPDAPYPTLAANNGASHSIQVGICLGTNVDGEADGQPNATATGDDTLDGSDDENGVVFPAPLVPSSYVPIQVTVTGSGFLNAWIDFNGNGSWADIPDQICTDVWLANETRTIWIWVPPSAAGGTTTFARFRFNGSGMLYWYGSATGGEVEDYTVDIEPTRPREPKWNRPLDTSVGIDILSYDSETAGRELVADDFVSDGRPIYSVKWWGSYQGYLTNQPGPVDPPFADRPSAFHLFWYNDRPDPDQAGPDYSHPTNQIQHMLMGLEQYQSGMGPVTENYATSIYHWVTDKYEHEFVYEAVLYKPWNEKEDGIYWIGIQAEYGATVPSNKWGWATTSLDYHWNDDAVREDIAFPQGWQELYYDEVRPGHPYGHESVDMAVVLYTDVTNRRARKWVQPPDMVEGENMVTWQEDQGTPPPGGWALRADDFVSDGRRITDIHWWGSYLDYLTNQAGPVAHPDNQTRPLSFVLSWHEDSPGGGPGALLREIDVPFSRCHEVYYGTVTQTWKGSSYYEHEFQYYVDLLDQALGGDAQPWPEQAGTTYWLNVQAVLPSLFLTNNVHTGWGWKTTPPTNRWNQSSVLSNQGAWVPAQYPTNHPLYPQNCDLAFELTTDVVGTNKYYVQPKLSHLDLHPTGGYAWLSSYGDLGAGVQVLQFCTNLVASNWVDVATNPIPLRPPSYNTWMVNWDTNIPLGCYRIIQRP